MRRCLIAAARGRQAPVGSGSSPKTVISAGSRPPWRSVTYAMNPARPPPTIAQRSLTTDLLHRPCEHALDEVALEGEEDDERQRERDERRGRDDLDVRAELGQLVEDRNRDRLRVAGERERDDEVVPRPQELEDRERRDGREPEREDEAEEDPKLGGAVDARGLEDVLGYPDEEVPEQEDREREPEGRVEEDEAQNRVVDPERVVEGEDRDQRHLQRDHEERDDEDEEPVAPGELEPREGVGGERADRDRENRRAERDLDRDPERMGDRAVREELVVVADRRQARMADHLPPAHAAEVLRCHERRQEQSDRGDQPDGPDED